MRRRAEISTLRFRLLSHFASAYQIGELQARSWMVAGTLVSGGIFSRTAS